MTEPVPRVHVRRTVRMASALIAVQVALGAVIGFVTFGTQHHGRPVSATPNALAPPPRPSPPGRPAPTGPRAGGTGPPAGTSGIKRIPPTTVAAATTDAGLIAEASPTPPRGPAPPGPGKTVAPSDPAGDTFAPSVVTPAAQTVRPAPPPTPSPAGSVQTGVVLGAACSPAGAPGRTASGSPVTCLPGDDDELIWKSTG